MAAITTDLLSWIEDKDGIAILYPQSLDVSNVVASLLTIPQIHGKTTVLMVQDQKGVNQATGQDLPKDLYIPYGPSNTLNRALKVRSYIIVDSLAFLRMARIESILQGKISSCKIIILASVGTDNDDLNFLTNIFSNMNWVRLQIADEGPTLVYRPQITIMTAQQVKRYEKRRQQEQDFLSSNSDDRLDLFRAKETIRTLQIGNLIYPQEIQDQLDIDNSPSLLQDDTDRHQGGWMSQELVSTFGSYSPKIVNLLTIIETKFSDKHVVFSRFQHRYGLDCLNSFLHYLGVAHIMITDVDSHQEKIGKLSEFSRSRDIKVLLLSVVPPQDIDNVANLHFLEGVDFTVYQGLLTRIYKRHLYSDIIGIFTIYFHIAQKDDTDSSDAVYYNRLTQQIRQAQQTYLQIYRQSLPLGYVTGVGLAVSDLKTTNR